MKTRVILKKGKEYPVRKFHPWIYSGAIEESGNELSEGEIVEVYSYDGQFLALGYWNGGGIAVKILSFAKDEIDQDYWNEKILNAKVYRDRLSLTNNPLTNAFRVFNAEGDGVPGLIIDKYANNFVVQFQTLALEKFQSEIFYALKGTYKVVDSIIVTTSIQTKIAEGNLISDVIEENGIKYFVDLLKGQKTGFFLDQRNNRQLITQYSNNKNVLNAFCYSGGFSLSALKGEAKKVISVDSSKDAISLLERNLGLNNLTQNHGSVSADFFDYINKVNESFDLIILDPPAFCKHRDALENALKGYSSLNQQAMLKLSRGGMLATFSCSQLVSKERFKEAVILAASRAGKHFKIIKELQASECHPVSLSHPEGEYLKGLLLISA